jgi:hypothetical protein
MTAFDLGIWALIGLGVVMMAIALWLDVMATNRLFARIRELEARYPGGYRQRVRDKVAYWEWVTEPDDDWPPFSLTCDEIMKDARHG